MNTAANPPFPQSPLANAASRGKPMSFRAPVNVHALLQPVRTFVTPVGALFNLIMRLVRAVCQRVARAFNVQVESTGGDGESAANQAFTAPGDDPAKQQAATQAAQQAGEEVGKYLQGIMARKPDLEKLDPAQGGEYYLNQVLTELGMAMRRGDEEMSQLRQQIEERLPAVAKRLGLSTEGVRKFLESGNPLEGSLAADEELQAMVQAQSRLYDLGRDGVKLRVAFMDHYLAACGEPGQEAPLRELAERKLAEFGGEDLKKAAENAVFQRLSGEKHVTNRVSPLDSATNTAGGASPAAADKPPANSGGAQVMSSRARKYAQFVDDQPDAAGDDESQMPRER